jgi:hypothetical protein
VAELLEDKNIKVIEMNYPAASRRGIAKEKVFNSQQAAGN